MRSPGRFIAALAGGTLVVGAALVSGAPAHADSTAPIAGSAPAWLPTATKLGSVSASSRVTAIIDLAPRGGMAALQRLAGSVSDPKRARYHHFLTRHEYTARFAPSTSAVGGIRRFASRAGLSVVGVAQGDDSVTVSGTAAQAEKAFGVRLNRYRHDEQTVTAPDRTLSVPVGLRATVLGVRGLDTTRTLVKPLATPAPPPAGYRTNVDCSSYYGEKAATAELDGTPLPKFRSRTLPKVVCGYTGKTLRTAYEQGSSYSGRGVGVAVVDAYAAPTIADDVDTYARRHGDQPYGAGQLRQYGAAVYTDLDECGASDWFGEETLDIEAVHAMAQNAGVRYYGAASCNDPDFLTAENRAIDDPSVRIVTNSWGDLPSAYSADQIRAWERTFLKAAVVSVSVLFSSGDDGDEVADTGAPSVEYPAGDPFVTAIGGTSTAINAAGAIIGTTGWGTEKFTLSADASTWTDAGFNAGAGGGAASFAKPWYQYWITGAGRQVPDIAMDADPNTGMLIGETQAFSDGTYYDEYRVGGTSLASPLAAGAVALVSEKARRGLGFLNPALYARPSAITDVTSAFPDAGNVRAIFNNDENGADGYSYSVRTFDDDSSLTTGPGYDHVTGLGVPNLQAFGVGR